MKFFADASYLANLYFEQRLAALAHQIEQLRLVASITSLVALELHLIALRAPGERLAGWQQLQTDTAAGKWLIEPVPWERIIEQAEAFALWHSRRVKPGTLDSLHVACARHLGATHFISFDVNSAQRAFAKAVGLQLVPRRLTIAPGGRSRD